MKRQVIRWSVALTGWLLCLGVAGWRYTTPHGTGEDRIALMGIPAGDPLDEAFVTALTAAKAAQTADSSQDWQTVAQGWADAVDLLRQVSRDRPEWIFAQRKAREYLANQAIAQQLAQVEGMPIVFPSLGSDVLDEQVSVYLSYLATFGPPDVMVIGSSRALQGINPEILQSRLGGQGISPVQVYTFAVNGATAQVMSFILQDLLTPEQLPRMIVWAGGSRSFNSARADQTFAKIAASPGFAALQAGDRPGFDWIDGEDTPETSKATPPPVTAINGYGFLPITDVFDPATYYRKFPRVSGRYDAAYQPFRLEGVQTEALRAIAAYTQTHAIPLIFVNLPLSSDYLDETRLRHEQTFRQYLQRESDRGNFTVVDLLQQWPTQNQFFADPSHLNQLGAAQVAIYLAEEAPIPWKTLMAPPAETSTTRSDDPQDAMDDNPLPI